MNLNFKRILASAALIASFAQTATARPLTSAQKLDDFRTFVSIIEANYGPLEYKMSNKIVDISLLNLNYERKIQATATNREFYNTMVQYVAEYHDGHFGIRIPSTLTAILPIVTDLVDGKVLITSIDRSKLSQQQFSFAVGDEILSVDGQPIAEFLTDAASYISEGRAASARRVASWLVFFRRGARMPVPAADKIKVEIRRGTSTVIEIAELKWVKEGTELDMSTMPSIHMQSSAPTAPMNFDNLTNNAFKDYIHPSADRSFQCSGTTRISIPDGSTVIMREPFVAYYHPTAKGNVGYLRIPHYYPQPGPGETDLQVQLKWLAQYEFAVRELETNTVGLIIDQDHNCGGSVWIVNKMISMFMDKPFLPSQFELLANRESYNDFSQWTNSTPQHSIEHELMQRVLNLIETTWLHATSRLTPKVSIDGETQFLPNAIHYTKPVVMLIDELAGSGGDMFPSMMQGLGRVKLFGQTTSGLGGHIQSFPAGLPNSQMTFSLTKSLFYRPDGVAIENHGAVPDQTYTITRDDILYGYKDYQKAYLSYLAQFLP